MKIAIDPQKIIALVTKIADAYVKTTPSETDDLLLAVAEQILARIFPPVATTAGLAPTAVLPAHVQSQVDALVETCRAAA